MVTINILDGDYDKYLFSRTNSILGRMYDNESEYIKVIKPKSEKSSVCTMIITNGDVVVDHLLINEEPIPIRNNISQYENISIGFSFSREDGYVKNSEVKLFSFLRAQKPDDFVPLEPQQKINIDHLIGHAIINVKLNDKALDFYGVDNEVSYSVDLTPFFNTQSDLSIDDESSDNYIKNKSTKYLKNEGEDGNSKYATEKYVTDEIKTLQDNQHKHTNQKILDATTASFTERDKQNLDSINNQLKSDGDGDKYLSDDGTYKEVPTNRTLNKDWKIEGTTLEFIKSILADSSAMVGTSFLGGVRFSDLPDGLGNAECLVQVISSTLGSDKKVIHLDLYSATTSPYHWSTIYYSSLPTPIWQGDVRNGDIPSIEGLASESYVDSKVNTSVETAKEYVNNKLTEMINSAPETLDTLGEIASAIQQNGDIIASLNSVVGTKQSANDNSLTTTSKTIVGAINELNSKIVSANEEIQNILGV